MSGLFIAYWSLPTKFAELPVDDRIKMHGIGKFSRFKQLTSIVEWRYLKKWELSLAFGNIIDKNGRKLVPAEFMPYCVCCAALNVYARPDGSA